MGKVRTYFEVDVNECFLGLVGATTNKTDDCAWDTYYVNHPLINLSLSNYASGGAYLSGCDGGIPDYDDETII